MTSWKHQLGKHLLAEGALTYIISDEDSETVSWDEEGKTKQQVDMMIFYDNYMTVVELKETNSLYRKGVSYKQIQRYYDLCNSIRYRTEFWAYVYWREYDTVVGIRMRELSNLQFHVVSDENKPPDFFVTMGDNPKKRIRKRVDFTMKIKPEKVVV